MDRTAPGHLDFLSARPGPAVNRPGGHTWSRFQLRMICSNDFSRSWLGEGLRPRRVSTEGLTQYLCSAKVSDPAGPRPKVSRAVLIHGWINRKNGFRNKSLAPSRPCVNIFSCFDAKSPRRKVFLLFSMPHLARRGSPTPPSLDRRSPRPARRGSLTPPCLDRRSLAVSWTPSPLGTCALLRLPSILHPRPGQCR